MVRLNDLAMDLKLIRSTEKLAAGAAEFETPDTLCSRTHLLIRWTNNIGCVCILMPWWEMSATLL